MSPKLNLKPDVLIIGAGISGITCALKCQEHDIDFMLIEKDSRAGGRLGSIYEEGYVFDIGFQVFNTSYTVTKSFLDLDQLDLCFFKPGALIHYGSKYEIISDPIRDLGQIFNTVFSNIATFQDKLKILTLKFSLLNYSLENDFSEDKETRTFLKDYGFSEKIINDFFSPFFAGVFLEKKLSTSSKFFKYVFSKLSKGLASIPKNGMQEIPENMLRNIDKENILFRSEVEKVISDQKIQLKDGQVFEPKKIIFTGTSQYLMNKKNLNHNSVKTIYFNTDSKPHRGKYIHIFPQEEYINNIAFLTSISTQYTKNKDHLLSVSVINSDISEHKLIHKVKRRLQNLYGGNFNFLKYFDIKQATVYQPANFINQQSNWVVNDNKYFAGDSMVHSSIEGAVLSGIEVMNKVKQKFS